MNSDEDPNISIGGNIGGSFIYGNGNVVNAPKPFNDKGIFLPMARNALFTGREAALAELRTALTPSPSPEIGRGENVVITQAVTGMGGIGKSQLALEFAYRSLAADDFVSAHWLNLADPTQLNAEIAACGRQMGLLDDTVKQPDMVAETLRVWGLRGPRLLVLDNYESAADALQTLAPLLNLSTLRLLITARRADFPPELGLRPYALEVFTPEDSLKFLRKLVKLSDDQTPDLEKLAETLGHLPLALHLVGHYLREEGITPAEYLRELDEVLAHESMQAEWFKEMGIASPTAHEQSLLGTFALSWHKVSDERAQTIFKVAGYLAPNTPIPVEIFAAVLEVEEKDRTLKHALRKLVDKVGLFTIKDGLPLIHPLLAAYARHLNGESMELLEKLADKLTILAKQANDQVEQNGSLTWFASLQAHVLAAAEYAKKANLQDAANLYGHLGYYLQIIADYLGACSADEHAIRILEANLGQNDPNVATMVSNLGLVLRDLGDWSGARAAIERALKIDETAFGKSHLKVAIRVNNLGSVLRDLGDMPGARAAFERAVQILEASLGENHPQVATSVNNLGTVLLDLGDLPGAHTAFERALKIDEAAFGKEHPNVARDVNNLGLALRDLGDLPGAHAALERALGMDEVTFGKYHPNIAIRLLNLGTVLQMQGNKEEARACYQRALAIWEQFLPAQHPYIELAKGWLKSLEGLP